MWWLVTQVQPPQRAAVHLAVAKAVHAVFLCYLRAAGAAEDGHASKAAVRSAALCGRMLIYFLASCSARLSDFSASHRILAWGLTCSNVKRSNDLESMHLLEHTLKSSAVIRVRPPQERLRLYEKKVRKLESERWLAHNSAQTQINVAAANRFISAAIPDLTATQRAALKTVRLL